MPTREERDRELEGWMHTDSERITRDWKAAHGTDILPVSIVRYSQLIEQVLAREFPQDGKAA